MINQYYNGYAETLDRDLTSQLNMEAIQMLGFDVLYMQRQYIDFDDFLGEDRENSFSKGKAIEMYCENTEGFDGAGEMKTLFGDIWEASATFIVNKERFKEEFPDLVRPKAGDILFMPYSNMLLEIRYVETESEFFPQSSSVFYKMRVEQFHYSHEDISNDIDESMEISQSFLGKLDEIILDNPSEDTGNYGDNAATEDESFSDRINIKKDRFKPMN